MSLKSALSYIQTLSEDKQILFKTIQIDKFKSSILLQNISSFINTQYFMHNEKSMKILLLECQRILLMRDLKEVNKQEWVKSMKKNNYHKKKFEKNLIKFLNLKNIEKIKYRYEFCFFIPLCDFIDYNNYRLF